MKRLVTIGLLCTALAACASPGGRGPGRLDAPPPGEPSGTTGLKEADLRRFYGQPAFIRKDANGQIWRFDAPSCKAYFFLYTRGADTAVWHVETTPRGVSIAADQNCLNALSARAGYSRPTS